MRLILAIATLLPSLALGANWVELGKTPEAKILLDADSVEVSGDEARAWLKFIYRAPQPGQTVTRGKPFDSSINHYVLACSAKKVQVLELVMFQKEDTVGSFHGHFDANNFDSAKPHTGAMYLIERICPGNGSAVQTN